MIKSTKTILSFILLFGGLILFMKANATTYLDQDANKPSDGRVHIKVTPFHGLNSKTQMWSINGKDTVIFEDNEKEVDVYLQSGKQYVRLQNVDSYVNQITMATFEPEDGASYQVHYNYLLTKFSIVKVK